MENIIGYYPALFRAIEISKAGGYTISVYFDYEYTNGFKDYKLIKEFCGEWFNRFVSDGDIKVEITPPKNILQNEIFETKKDISKRVTGYLNNKEPDDILMWDSNNLLKVAINKLELSLYEINKIKHIAKTIAKMDNSGTILAYHIAEAIQYMKIHDENVFCGEEKSKRFGNKIEIKTGSIDPFDIISAIAYLKSLNNKEL